MYSCPKCQSRFTLIKKLIWHLREIHALSEGLEFTLTCSQDGCPRTYHSINSFTKHLSREHQIASTTVVEPSLQTFPTFTDFPGTIDTTPLEENIAEPSEGFKLLSSSDSAASFVAKMYAGSNVTLMDVTRTVTCVKELVETTVATLQNSVSSVFNNLEVPHDHELVQPLMEQFESAKHMFDDIDTPFKMNTHFSEKFHLVKPKELFLGHRADTVRKQGQMKQVLAPDTCQYVPILETIKFLFSNEKMQNVYLKNKKRNDNMMRDYSDGCQFSTHPLFQLYPESLQIQLYYDDVETTNPLGSKTKIHKMGAVYFTLQNLPPECNSSLAHIHLCVLFNSIDREKYGLGKILEPLLEDIRVLENSGIEVEVNGQTQKLHGTLSILTADNLAIHSLCGYVESFSANKCCQFCLIDKQEIQSVFDEDNVEKRNRENYEQHVRFCDPSSTGVKGNSCLNSLQYFHVTENTCVDIMHDVLEGVAPLEVKLLLRHFIYEEKLFTLEQLNQRIAGFDYGYMNEKNKPSAIINLRSSENAVRQTASQMWCLLQVLPFLVGDFINREDQFWHLFILLREICSIIFAPVVSVGLAVFLKQLIIDHHTLYKKLFCQNLIPKHHFMIHYPRMLCLFGPISHLWCMRFESKHNPMKRQAHVVCNFKNIAKTLAYKHQVQQM